VQKVDSDCPWSSSQLQLAFGAFADVLFSSPCHASQVMEVAWISVADISQDLGDLGTRVVEAKGDMSAVFPTRFAHLVPCAAAQPTIISDMLVQFGQVCVR
jgi:hypothetical protein